MGDLNNIEVMREYVKLVYDFMYEFKFFVICFCDEDQDICKWYCLFFLSDEIFELDWVLKFELVIVVKMVDIELFV